MLGLADPVYPPAISAIPDPSNIKLKEPVRLSDWSDVSNPTPAEEENSDSV